MARVDLDQGGSMPISGLAPKPPPVLVLYEDLAELGDDEKPSAVYGQYTTPMTPLRPLVAKLVGDWRYVP